MCPKPTSYRMSLAHGEVSALKPLETSVTSACIVPCAAWFVKQRRRRGGKMLLSAIFPTFAGNSVGFLRIFGGNSTKSRVFFENSPLLRESTHLSLWEISSRFCPYRGKKRAFLRRGDTFFPHLRKTLRETRHVSARRKNFPNVNFFEILKRTERKNCTFRRMVV